MPRHIPALDGLRAFAVAAVIAYHAGGPVPGDLGVAFFFVLSGFLITHLLLEEHRTSGTVSLRQFYVRRTLRIFPAYQAFVAASWAADTVLGHPWPAALTAAAFGYWVNYFNAWTHTHTGTVAHAWSLAVEEQFYLLWPLLFVTLVRRGRSALATAVAALIVGVLVWRSWLYLHAAPHGAVVVYNRFDTRFDSLAIGCLLAVCWPRLSTTRWSLLSPAVTLIGVLVVRMALPAGFHFTVGFTVEAALMALLLWQMVGLAQSKQLVWIEAPTLRWLGALSYPLYLWHAWGLNIGHKFLWLPTWAQIGLGVAASIGLASLSYYVVERPFLRLKGRFAAQRSEVVRVDFASAA